MESRFHITVLNNRTQCIKHIIVYGIYLSLLKLKSFILRKYLCRLTLDQRLKLVFMRIQLHKIRCSLAYYIRVYGRNDNVTVGQLNILCLIAYKRIAVDYQDNGYILKYLKTLKRPYSFGAHRLRYQFVDYYNGNTIFILHQKTENQLAAVSFYQLILRCKYLVKDGFIHFRRFRHKHFFHNKFTPMHKKIPFSGITAASAVQRHNIRSEYITADKQKFPNYHYT